MFLWLFLAFCLISHSARAQVNITSGQNAATIEANITSAMPTTGTLSVTGTGTVTAAVNVNVPSGVTVLWSANISGSTASANDGVLNISGSGHFEVNGNITQTGTGFAIRSGTTGNTTVSGNAKLSAGASNDIVNTVGTTGHVFIKDNAELISSHRVVNITGTSQNVTVDGGTLQVTSGARPVIYNQSTGSSVVTINGGTLTHAGGSSVINTTNGNVVVTNNSKLSTGENSVIYTAGATSTVTISGGSLENTGTDAIIVMDNASPTVAGANVIVSGGALKNTSNVSNANLILTNGSVDIKGDAKLEIEAGTVIRTPGNVAISGNATLTSKTGRVVYITSTAGTLTVSGGALKNTSTDASVIQTSGHVVISGNATLTSTYRVVDLTGGNLTINVGSTSTLTLESGTREVIRNNNNTNITIGGGILSNKSSGFAIQNVGTGSVSVTGGVVRATGVAISANGPVSVSGGLVFTYGKLIPNDVFTGSSPTINSTTGKVIVWDYPSGAPTFTYTEGTSNHLIANAGAQTWGYDKDAGFGISYSNGTNTGFLPIEGVKVLLTPKPGDFDPIEPKSYTGVPQSVVIPPLGESGWMGAVTVKYGGSETPPAKVGTYAITVDVAAGTVYAAASNLSLGDFKIIPAELTITGFAITKPYDGTTAFEGENFGELKFAGLQNGETASVSTTGVKATFAGTTSGEHGITFAGEFGMTGGTADPANYIIIHPTDITGIITGPPSVTAVEVSPDEVDVQKGEKQPFKATVIGENKPAQTVTWSVEGGVAGTAITAAGVLAIADDETAATLTVKATSTVDDTKFGTATVTVTDDPVPPVIIVEKLPDGKVGTAYSYTFFSKGNTPVWSLDEEGGALPDGLTLSTGGLISGTPKEDGTFTFTVIAENGAGSDSQEFSVKIDEVGIEAPVITTPSLINGKVGEDYEETLAFTGDEPITWSVSTGNLPGGLQLSSGVISGKPTTAGTYNFTVKASNDGGFHEKALSIVVDKGVGATVSTPVLSSKTSNSITISAVAAPANGQSVEYVRATTATVPSDGWQSGLVFAGLNANTTYYIFARAIGNDDYLAGAASSSLSVTTDKVTGSGEIPQVNPLKAWIRNGLLHVSGLTPGLVWKVYNISGTLVCQDVAESEEADISLTIQGIYIIQSGNNTLKVVFN